MPRLVLVSFLVWGVWLIKRDTSQRDGISASLWIPTIWVGILVSRPVSGWLGGVGGATDTLEGSPIDRLIFFGLIVAAFVTVSRRSLPWSVVISKQWPLFLFYFYLLISVLWAESSFVSSKRWFKEFGNIVVLLVILTEVNPLQALRTVFVRCGYVMIPLSIIYIRWFPNLGRRYSGHTGEVMAIGVADQKNSLGALVLVCGLVLVWDWLERWRPGITRLSKFDRYLPLAYLIMGAYLLRLSDSKTSIVCLILGTCILVATRFPLFRKRIGRFGGYTLGSMAIFYVLDSLFGITDWLVSSMGRNMTFTGRTDVWRELLALRTDPVFGLGFCSIWSDRSILSRLPEWVAMSAHNGYLEMYLDGGAIAVFLLLLMLLAAALRINRELSVSGNYALFRFTVLLVMIIANFSESHFGRMSPLGFLFLFAAIDIPPSANTRLEYEIEARVGSEPVHASSAMSRIGSSTP